MEYVSALGQFRDQVARLPVFVADEASRQAVLEGIVLAVDGVQQNARLVALHGFALVRLQAFVRHGVDNVRLHVSEQQAVHQMKHVSPHLADNGFPLVSTADLVFEAQ